MNETEVKDRLKELPEWKWLEEGAIERLFEFRSFREAFSFMARVAFEAEELNHHPDWENVYNRVRIKLNTHDAGGVTDKDFDLARRIEGINWR